MSEGLQLKPFLKRQHCTQSFLQSAFTTLAILKKQGVKMSPVTSDDGEECMCVCVCAVSTSGKQRRTAACVYCLRTVAAAVSPLRTSVWSRRHTHTHTHHLLRHCLTDFARALSFSLSLSLFLSFSSFSLAKIGLHQHCS